MWDIWPLSNSFVMEAVLLYWVSMCSYTKVLQECIESSAHLRSWLGHWVIQRPWAKFLYNPMSVHWICWKTRVFGTKTCHLQGDQFGQGLMCIQNYRSLDISPLDSRGTWILVGTLLPPRTPPPCTQTNDDWGTAGCCLVQLYVVYGRQWKQP